LRLGRDKAVRVIMVASIIAVVWVGVYVLVTMKMITLNLIGWLIRTTLEWSTPLVLTALGGMFSERSGVVNIGLEGMILIGAFGAAAASWFTLNPWIGLLAGMAAGGLLAAAHALVSITFKGNQIVSGTGVILFAAGFTTVMLKVVWNQQGTSPSVPSIPNVVLPLAGVPVLDTAFGQLSPIVYLMLVAVVVSSYVLYRTPFGLRLRAAGEDPSTLDTAGVSVDRMRWIGVVISGCMAGLAGGYLSISFLPYFSKGMSSGRGFIALAALIFGNWTPIGCFLAGTLFGFLNGLQNVIQILNIPGVGLYLDFIQMIPYVLVVVALGVIRRSVPPKAVGVAYEKEAKA
jgi:simple sugar transport system permease protein